MEQRFIAENVFRAVVPENIYRRQEFCANGKASSAFVLLPAP